MFFRIVVLSMFLFFSRSLPGLAPLWFRCAGVSKPFWATAGESGD